MSTIEEIIAAAILPEWHPADGGEAACSNYSGQTLRYQQRAAEMAGAVIADLDAAGYVIVPKTPTESMSVNGGIAFEDSMFGVQDPLVFDGARKCYLAMIEARPK